MSLLRILGEFLTVLFFVGIVGSCVVVVLFLAELFRTVLRGDQGSNDSVPSS